MSFEDFILYFLGTLYCRSQAINCDRKLSVLDVVDSITHKRLGDDSFF